MGKRPAIITVVDMSNYYGSFIQRPAELQTFLLILHDWGCGYTFGHVNIWQICRSNHDTYVKLTRIGRGAMFLQILSLFLNFILQTDASNDGISKFNQCDLYLAPSLTPGIGRGVFAGSSYAAGETIMNSVTLLLSADYTIGWQIVNYYWGTEEPSISLAEFGPGMLINHKNPPSILHSWPSLFTMSAEQELSHTTSTSVPSIATRDIATGEELFVSYSEGNDWLQERGVFITDAAEKDTYDPPHRSAEELQRIGICMTDVKVII